MSVFEFDQPCELWTCQLINKFMWALAPEFEFSDIFHECYLKYLVVTSKYTLENQEHGMALYMTACRNRVSDMARKRRERPHMISHFKNADGGDEVDVYSTLRDEYDVLGEAILDEEMSPPLRQLFERSDWWRNVRRVRQCKHRKDGTRETTNGMLCRLAGVDQKRYDLRGELSQIVAI